MTTTTTAPPPDDDGNHLGLSETSKRLLADQLTREREWQPEPTAEMPDSSKRMLGLPVKGKPKKRGKREPSADMSKTTKWMFGHPTGKGKRGKRGGKRK